MIYRERPRAPAYIYPIEEWRLVEKRFSMSRIACTETLFATANGYLGMRGGPEEGRPAYRNGTFVNGFYESWPIVYAEDAFGFAKTGQTIVNAPDAKIIHLYVDDEPFFLPTAELEEFERALDMKQGVLDRNLVWETAAGKLVSVRSRRLVSLEHRHLAAIRYEVTLLNAAAPVVISSQVVHYDDEQHEEADDPRAAARFRGRVLHPRIHEQRDQRLAFAFGTARSDMRVACAVDHVMETDAAYSCEPRCVPDEGKIVFTIDATPEVPIVLTKFITYHTSHSAPPRQLADRAHRSLDRAVRHGFDALLAGQREYMDDFWRRSDVQVEGDPEIQQALRFNLFHILQASARAEGAGVPAKGLTGDGYEGHYFWDTEIYLLPFLTYTSPRTAQNLLRFRYSYLDKARERAREVNQKGALFPWRTISGEEASAYYAAGTAQYHINADIMYALRKYVDVTGDLEILRDCGAEMLVETARLWRDLGFFSKRRGGRFCIHGVTGPDEYNTVVDNNTYTNLMARENLWCAVELLETLHKNGADWYQELVDRTALEPSEVEGWREAADRMYLCFDEEEGIHPQDDDFLYKKPWDFENTPHEKYPLLLHYHPLVIYRHQVIKQADVILAMFLLGDEFSPEQKKRNFDYYDPLTTGDSSLSACIQAIAAAEAGYLEKARRYARWALLMDLDDVAGNVRDGCHIASMGGTWMIVVYGLAGMRDYGGRVSFRPRVPERFGAVRIPLRIRGRQLAVEIRSGATTYTLLEGEDLAIWHGEEEIRLTAGAPTATRPNEPQGPPTPWTTPP